ncbi:MAG: DUF1670 domain-containing protein [Chloroflexi bacterium]|nr:DUF1670 domain-containing protein [Chloroflexota bacterium]
MKTRTSTDRLQEKTPTKLMTNHLRQRYKFSPVIAEALSDDLQLLSNQMSGNSQLTDGQVLYPAVKAAEPAGKALKDCEYEMVRLTIYAQSDIAYRQQHGLKTLKKHILHRITEEADAQGAPLTYEDLSRLLFADRKTIGKYLQEIQADGEAIVTRSTYTDASARITHHRPIVRLFLLNYTESEIGQRTNHTLSRVEGYIKDFLRICVAHRQGYSVEGIRHLTGLSKRVVEKHLAHYVELRVAPFWEEHLERKLRFYETSIDANLAKKGGLA